MKPNRDSLQHHVLRVDEAIESTCEAIAPVWPLDQFIAVNPFHGWRSTSFLKAAEKLGRLSGASLFMPPSYYLEAWNKGSIRPIHLEHAIKELGESISPGQCLKALESTGHNPVPRPMLSDILDSERDLQHEPAWGDVILRQISRFCAAWFDHALSDWRLPGSTGLYADWRDAIRHEHGITLLMRDTRILKRSKLLPDDARSLIGNFLESFDPGGETHTDVLTSALLRINGWASWCAYLRWQARQNGQDNHLLEELLAIRLSWERLLDEGRRDPSSPWQRWKNAWTRQSHDARQSNVLPIWQRALELGYQMPLENALSRNKAIHSREQAEVQMAFCIDVRSEVIRRAVESQGPGIRTLGVAGFFGLPIAYRPLGTREERPQLPGLFKPRYLVSDSTGNGTRDRTLEKKIRTRLSRLAQADPFQKMPASAFTLVEALGLGYVAKLLARTFPGILRPGLKTGLPVPGGKIKDRLRPALPETLSMTEKTDLVAGILKAMSLTSDFAPLVVLVGHGSKTVNNPHASGLDCGACGGRTGKVNVRLLAGLLNDAGLRSSLRERGLHIPDETHFLAALHNTTTDEVDILDTEDIPERYRAKVGRLQKKLINASGLARIQRASRLGLGELSGRPGRLLKAMHGRTMDWSQTRPEWGLANNAAFIAAPRSRTAGIDLEGRVFLHDYDPSRDTGGEVLELIMTGPMVVATWINMQYYASTVDNKRFGSGNKVLHNVVGGHIGVFEGNGGDLRTGLPIQSLHDGRHWMHTPQRLSIYLEATARAIETVLDKNALVRDLVDNGWVFLSRIDPDTHTVERYLRRKWSTTNRSTVLK